MIAIRRARLIHHRRHHDCLCVLYKVNACDRTERIIIYTSNAMACLSVLYNVDADYKTSHITAYTSNLPALVDTDKEAQKITRLAALVATRHTNMQLQPNQIAFSVHGIETTVFVHVSHWLFGARSSASTDDRQSWKLRTKSMHVSRCPPLEQELCMHSKGAARRLVINILANSSTSRPFKCQ